MLRILIPLIPYALQLLCILHIVKTRRETYWIWIIIMVPYAGGIAYLLIEILPGVVSARHIHRVKDSIVDMIRPGQKLEAARQKAMYSSTHNNMVEYADALAADGNYEEAHAIYQEESKGIFKNDQELIFKLACSYYQLDKLDDALTHLERLRPSGETVFKRNEENLLYLRLVERMKPVDDAKREYEAIQQKKQDHEIELQYIDFLRRQGDGKALADIFARLRFEAEVNKRTMNAYQKNFYAAAFKIERDMKKSGSL